MATGIGAGDEPALAGLPAALIPMAEALEAELRQSLEFARQTEASGWEPAAAIVTGQAAHHEVLAAAVRRGLGCESLAGIEFGKVRIVPDRASELRHWAPSLVTAYGLALQGVGKAVFDLNLTEGLSLVRPKPV